MNPETRKALTESVKQQILADLQLRNTQISEDDRHGDNLLNTGRSYSRKSTRQAYHDLVEAIWQDILVGVGSVEGFVERKIGRGLPLTSGKGESPDRGFSPEEREKIKKDILNELQATILDKSKRDNSLLAASIKKEVLAELEAQGEAWEKGREPSGNSFRQQRKEMDNRNREQFSRAEAERIKRDILKDLRLSPDNGYYSNCKD
ncbi:MAG: hypothetical protein HQP61_05980 [Peptococcaceae bacterium]|nr:hypothetical protein [Candidatus Syntrophopropionicum ammoniitolerans]